jgi:hypothetical protein
MLPPRPPLLRPMPKATCTALVTTHQILAPRTQHMVISLARLVPRVPTARQMHRAPCARQGHRVRADLWVPQMVVVMPATDLPRKSVEDHLVSQLRAITQIT